MLILYLICLLIFLVPINIIITKQLYEITKQYLVLYKSKNWNQANVNQDLYIIRLATVYIKRNLWLSCIQLLEKEINTIHPYCKEFYQFTGFCYLKMNLYPLAEYYYVQARNIEPNNIISLLNIAKIYSLTDRIADALSIYYKVLSIDRNNRAAKQSIKMMIRSDRSG